MRSYNFGIIAKLLNLIEDDYLSPVKSAVFKSWVLVSHLKKRKGKEKNDVPEQQIFVLTEQVYVS